VLGTQNEELAAAVCFGETAARPGQESRTLGIHGSQPFIRWRTEKKR
jgi:hypothetical protein